MYGGECGPMSLKVSVAFSFMKSILQIKWLQTTFISCSLAGPLRHSAGPSSTHSHRRTTCYPFVHVYGPSLRWVWVQVGSPHENTFRLWEQNLSSWLRSSSGGQIWPTGQCLSLQRTADCWTTRHCSLHQAARLWGRFHFYPQRPKDTAETDTGPPPHINALPKQTNLSANEAVLSFLLWFLIGSFYLMSHCSLFLLLIV